MIEREGGGKPVKLDKNIAKWFIIGSAVAVVLAILAVGGQKIFLAGTQWLLVAAVLGVWGLYSRTTK